MSSFLCTSIPCVFLSRSRMRSYFSAPPPRDSHLRGRSNCSSTILCRLRSRRPCPLCVHANKDAGVSEKVLARQRQLIKVETWWLVARPWEGVTVRGIGSEGWRPQPWRSWGAAGALVPVQSALWGCHPWRRKGDALVWFKAGHQVGQPWRLLGGDLLQTELSLRLCPAQGHLAGATNNPQVAATLSGPPEADL